MKIKRIGIFAVLLAFSVSLCACGEARRRPSIN